MYGLVFQPGSIPMRTDPSLLLRVWPLLQIVLQPFSLVTRDLAMSFFSHILVPAGLRLAKVFGRRRVSCWFSDNCCWGSTLVDKSLWTVRVFCSAPNILRPFQSYRQRPKEFVSILSHLESQSLSFNFISLAVGLHTLNVCLCSSPE